MADTGLFYWSDKLGKTNPRELIVTFSITGAKTVVQSPVGFPSLPTFDAIASQSVIDDFLGTVDEFTVAQFDATSMGADAFGCLINMAGQVQALVDFTIECYSSGNTLVTRHAEAGVLADSTLETAIELGADGNLAFKVNFGNTPDFDGLTAGTIQAKIRWISK